jgi:hypothetical protein
MSPRTDLHTPDDVVARLRQDAHAVPHVRFDTSAVLATARRALRRRRRRQAVVGVVGAGLVALTVAGPVHLSGVGTFAMPGGHQVRIALGVGDPDAPTPAAGFDLGELRDWLAQFSTEPPSPETMAEEAAGLQEHVLPVLEDIRPTWYEANQGCDVLEYPRGTFSDDGKCAGRAGEQQFDQLARTDLDRLVAAVRDSGVPSEELRSASYAPDGTVISASIARTGGGIEWNFSYLYSPESRPRDWESGLGPVTITPIGNSGWYFEQAPND